MGGGGEGAPRKEERVIKCGNRILGDVVLVGAAGGRPSCLQARVCDHCAVGMERQGSSAQTSGFPPLHVPVSMVEKLKHAKNLGDVRNLQQVHVRNADG